MEKTTVYLTESQKRALGTLARQSGRSEAELIREGVDLVTAARRAAEPTLPLFDSGDPTLAERVDELLEASASDDPPGHERAHRRARRRPTVA